MTDERRSSGRTLSFEKPSVLYCFLLVIIFVLSSLPCFARNREPKRVKCRRRSEGKVLTFAVLGRDFLPRFTQYFEKP